MELFGTALYDELTAIFDAYRREKAAIEGQVADAPSATGKDLLQATAQLAEQRTELEKLLSSTQLEPDPELEHELEAIEEEFARASEQARLEVDKRIELTLEMGRAKLAEIDAQLDRLASVALLYSVEQLGSQPTGVVARSHDIQSLRELANKANEEGAGATIKRMLETDGYYDRAKMATDVLRKREEMSQYLFWQRDELEAELADLRDTAERIVKSDIQDAEDTRAQQTLEARLRSSERMAAARRVRQMQLEMTIREGEARLEELQDRDRAERADATRGLDAALADLASSTRATIEALDLEDVRASYDRAWETYGARGDVFGRAWSAAPEADHRVAVLRRHMRLDVPAELADMLQPLGDYVDAETGKLECLDLMDASRPEPILIRYKEGRRDAAIAAARRLVLSATRAVAPATVEMLACDPIGQGTSLGCLGPLFAAGRRGANKLATTNPQVGALLGSIVDGMGETGAAVASSTPPTVAHHNATHPGHELPYRVLVLFDIDRGEYRESELNQVASILRHAADFGIMVVMVRQDKAPERRAAREKPLKKIEGQSTVITLGRTGHQDTCSVRPTDAPPTSTCELLCDDTTTDAFLGTIPGASRG